MVYVGKRYTVTATGAAMRGACCENCGCEYLYRIERAAKGEGSSPYFLGAESAKRRAAKEAQDSLQRQLRDVDPVPCPDCGWLQDAMVRKMRQKYYWILGPTVFAAVCLGLVFYFAKGVGQPFSTETHLYAAAGTVLLVALWWILRSNFDPNRVKSLRRNDENDTTRAILRSEYEPRLAEFPPEMRFALVKVMKEIDQAKRAQALSPREQFDLASAAEAESACKRRANIQLAVWAVTGLAALLAIWPACGGYAERAAYASVLEQKNVAEADRYLREHPQGAHAEEVRELRDDWRFETALNEFKRTQNSAALLSYLNDAGASKHVEQARLAIGQSFDAGIQRLESALADRNADPELCRGLIEVLRSHGDTIDVAITAQINEQPDPDQLAEETASIARNKSADPAIAKLISEAHGSDAVIPFTNLSAGNYQQRMEQAMLNNLQQLFDNITGSHLLRVRRSSIGEINLAYRIHPSGAVAGMKRPIETPDNYGESDNRPVSAVSYTFIGFARIYAIDWSLTMGATPVKRATKWSTQPDSEFYYTWKDRTSAPELYTAMFQRAVFLGNAQLLAKLRPVFTR